LVAFAAHAGAFAALGGEDVGVSGVGVAPAQVGVQVAGQDNVVGVVGVGLGDASLLGRVPAVATMNATSSSLMRRGAPPAR
jgi:hypothetical protein